MAYLSRLTLANYRNFREAELALPAGVSVCHGQNAQGKTALLEAAYTLAIGRSFRADREREVVHFDAARRREAAYITGVADCGGQSITAVIGYLPAAASAPPADDNDGGGGAAAAAGAPSALPPVSKQIRVNRQAVTAAGLVGRIGAILFSVDDLELALGAPARRRRYLDVLICQAQRSYLTALQRYQAALRNRNGLLRRRREGHVDAEELQYWDDRLVESGALVTMTRAGVVAQLGELGREHYRELAAPAATLSLSYRPSVPVGATPEETAEGFRHLLRQRAAREQASATTAAGPHRDDFGIFADGLDAGAFASRGEARTMALALRLAEAGYLAEARQDAPIILLDDVCSEMDAGRRERVLRKAAGYGQTLLTTTDVGLTRAGLGDSAAYFRVAGGTAIRES